MTGSIPISFDGRPLMARRGETLLAALVAAGEMVLREDVLGTAHGAYCGMGVCHECLVQIDGEAPQRACLAKIDGAMVVTRARDPIALPDIAAARAPRCAEDLPLLTPELLVIGAGPAGLAAASAARQAGVEVLVVDERSSAGGQFFKQVDVALPFPRPDRQHLEGARLILSAEEIGVQFRFGATVWGAFPGPVFAAADADGSFRIRPEATIIGTGGYERGWQVPGWTLPGVMTTGAAQSLWRTARRLPGRRVLIAGNGPLNLQLASELAQGGAEVVALVEAAEAPSLGKAGPLIGMASAAPRLVRDGMRMLGRLRRAGVPVHYGSYVEAISRSGAGLTARIGGDVATSLTADVVCLGYGLLPSNELARTLGCAFDADHVRGQAVPIRSHCGESSIAGVFLVGDGVRLGGAYVAMAEGKIAALEIARRRGRPVPSSMLRRAFRDLKAHQRFQRHLWAIYAPARTPLVPPTTEDTIICRCESVRLRDVTGAIADGYASASEIKHQTRLGMGRCQGRYCAEVLRALLPVSGTGSDLFTPRVPVRPVTIGDLAK